MRSAALTTAKSKERKRAMRVRRAAMVGVGRGRTASYVCGVSGVPMSERVNTVTELGEVSF